MQTMKSSAPGPRPARRSTYKSTAVRQQEIVDAAVQLIGSHGLRGTTVSRIAASVGISRGALYRHFPNREAVLEAALLRMAERSSSWLRQPTGDDVLSGLEAIGAAHSAWALSEFNTFVRPFFQLLASNRPGPLSDWMAKRQRDEFEHLVKVVEEGQSRGSIAADAHSGDIAWTLLLHAWGEDIARLIGVDQFITEGSSERILRRALDSYRASRD